MKKSIITIVVIFVFVSIGWLLLGGVTGYRSKSQDDKLGGEVEQLWGSVQKQQAPHAYYKDDSGTEQIINPESSDIAVDLNLEYRKKGGLWYSTYRVGFDAEYVVANPDSVSHPVFFEYAFPVTEGLFDNFTMIIGEERIDEVKPVGGKVVRGFDLEPGQSKSIRITYASQGLNEWWYVFGSKVTEIRNFNLTMTTNFDKINFPDKSISPPVKTALGSGWELKWEYTNLISSIQIGMEMPQRLNPGPVVSKASFYAPLALLLFLVMLVMITLIKGVDIHPVNYFFISAGFFSFSLLFAELTAHMDLNLAFIISAAISILLVFTYMRLVVGLRFALGWIMILQLVYFVAFSYSFLLPGYTGLFIVIFCILTLFLVMQLTGRIDWNRYFDMQKSPDPKHKPKPPGSRRHTPDPEPGPASGPWQSPYFTPPPGHPSQPGQPPPMPGPAPGA